MSYEQRFTSPPLDGYVFVRRPVSAVPPDGTICFVDGGTRDQVSHRAVGKWADGLWTDGKGRDLARAPTHWTAIERAA